MSNPFETPIDFNDPDVMKQANKLYRNLLHRRPSMKEITRKQEALMTREYRLQQRHNNFKEEILQLQLERYLYTKYEESKKQEEEEACAQDDELDQIRLAQLKLKHQEQELKAKRITTKKVIRNPAIQSVIQPAAIEAVEPAAIEVIKDDTKQIIVVDLNGKSHFVDLDLRTTIRDLFNYVFQNAGFPEEDCALRTDTNYLNLDKTFAEQGVEEQSRIYMHVRQRGGGKRRLRNRGQRRVEYDTQPSLGAKLFFANEAELDDLLKKMPKKVPKYDDSDEEDGISLGEESERSGDPEEYKRGKDSDYVPSEEGEGDDDEDAVESMVAELEEREDSWMLSPDHVSFLCKDAGLTHAETKMVLAKRSFVDPSQVFCIHCHMTLKEKRVSVCQDCPKSKNGCEFLPTGPSWPETPFNPRPANQN